MKLLLLGGLPLTKVTAAQNGYQSARAIFSGSYFCGDYIINLRLPIFLRASNRMLHFLVVRYFLFATLQSIKSSYLKIIRIKIQNLKVYRYKRTEL